MSRRLRPLAVLAMVALIGAGCSNGSAENDKTDTASSTATTTSSDSKNATHRDKAMRFAACMRENGVREFPDPSAAGELTIDAIANGSSLDTNSAAFKQAMSACKDLEPPGFTGHKRNSQQQEQALKFAQCIRDNGVKDFPDPAAGEPLVDTRRIPSASRPGGMTILNAAMQKCRDSLAGLVKRP
jgi:hypothetical protein